MPRSVHSLNVLLSAALLTSITSANAQEQSESGSESKRFKLSANYTAAAGLSRAEIDPEAASIGAKPPQSQPGVSVQPAAKGMSTLQLPPAAVPDDNPTAYLQEYNIDWSGWISTQADRWHFMLKASEALLGLRFVTARPAMIQFTCYADGSIGNIILRQSSGVPAYDRLQMETLMATMPTLPFPKGTARGSITLCQGWESHPLQPGETGYQPGTFGRDFPKERVRQWRAGR